MNEKLRSEIQEEIQSLSDLCRDYELTIPSSNKVAKNILLSFSDKVAALNSIILDADEENSMHSDSPLTKRETEILGHVSQGFTNKEIASALRVSTKTIEYHLSSILKKTESSNRTEAVKNAIDLQWIQ